MKRYLLILMSLLLLLSVETLAVIPWYPPMYNKKIKNNFFLELIGGINQSQLNYTDQNINAIKKGLNIGPSFGVAFRYRFNHNWALSPHLMYESKGLKTANFIEYKLKANYIDFSLPVEYSTRGKFTTFFAHLGPYIGTPMSGKIELNEFSTKINTSNINKTDFGFEVGFGVRMATFSENTRGFLRYTLTFMQGLTDTYSENEHFGISKSLNIPDYSIKGKRFNRGIRLTMSIELPFKSEKTRSFVAGGNGYTKYRRLTIY